ncbi:hypothetical protein M2175_003913 [Bradyrhizobium elkanii]|uniref:gluconate 2-dehydrogenase subunit 3 family protein n=1 Tax=Bradyrhizobium TaxID=374 RepID=UPI00216785D0|nr:MULTISPECIES: gluconate 2-dehydrogenase subunit 3 family protein [Bradyrhizobium]MCS3928882.1 hypothetical protein [Bradyrhizobium elkanii]MCS3969437.1 hypothetical protein [Bradyrhizobium japonicum]
MMRPIGNSPSRRAFLGRVLAAAPAIAAVSGAITHPARTGRFAAAEAKPARSCQPQYFTTEEWTLLTALVDRLITADEEGPGALEAGQPNSSTGISLRTRYEERYSRGFIPEGMTIQNHGVSYEEREPNYDFAEKVFGTSGQALRVKGQAVGDGNPFEADRSDQFPLPPQKNPYSAALSDGTVQFLRLLLGLCFMKAAKEAGFHPFFGPSANASQPYANPYG